MPGAADDESVASLSIRLLGPFDVRVNGAPLPHLRTRKGQWLLSLLVLRHGCEVERGWLAGTLWPDSDEAHALASLRMSLKDLRRALGAEARRLRAPGSHTLLLDLAGAEVDVAAFDAAIALGDEPSLARAVALYRGPLAEGCDAEWILPERQRREEDYLAALEALARHAEARGDHGAAVRHLRQTVATDPTRETAQRSLMRAMAAAGSHAAAMEVYRDFRLLLHRELSAEPDAETKTLFEQIRAEARRLVTTDHRRPTTGDGRAPHPSPTLPPAPTGGDLPPRHIPHPITALIGREREVGEITAALATARLVTLTGTGGVGKTRLAIQVAEELAEDFSDGTWFVDLGPLAEEGLVPQTVAASLGVPPVNGRPEAEGGSERDPLIGALRDFLRDKDLLLVLDNCEHLAPACACLAERLLSGCRRLRILVTSRHTLGLTGEVAWRVPSLSVPPADAEATGRGGEVVGWRGGEASWSPGHHLTTPPPHHLTPPPPERLNARTPERLMDFESVRLFVERAAAVRSGFALTASNAPPVAQVCRRLDGIPLAIELAAARVKLLSPAEIAERLDDRFRLLTGGSPTALPRHQTLRATLDWSYDLLPEKERVLLRRLCVFAGGWTLEAAEAVCSGVQAFRRSGVQEDENAEHSTPGHPDLEACEILDLLTHLVDRSLVAYEEQGGETRYRLLETVREYGRERLVEAGEDIAVREKHLDYFLTQAERAHSALWGPGQRQWLDRLEAEHDNLRAALDWILVVGNAEAGSRLAAALLRFWCVRGYLTEGRERVSKLLSLEGASGRTASRARMLYVAGMLAHDQGDYATAGALLGEGLAIRREVGDSRGLVGALTGLGTLARYQGDYSTARCCYEEALAVWRELGDKWGIACSLHNLAAVAHAEGKRRDAQTLYREGLVLFRGLDDRGSMAISLYCLGNLEWQQGNFGAARAYYEESLAIRRELADKIWIASTLNTLGELARHQADYERAEEMYAESLAVARDMGRTQTIAAVLHSMGSLARDIGDYRKATMLFVESLVLRRETGQLYGIANCLAGLGATAGGIGQPDRAARLLGAAVALHEASHAALSPASQADYDRDVAAARAQLDEAAFTAAWAEGRSMPLDQVIAYALEPTPIDRLSPTPRHT